MPEAGEGGLRGDEGEVRGRGGRGEEGARLDDAAGGVDEGADAGVGGPGQGAAVFHGPEHGHGELLVGGAAAAIPGVVGDVDQEIGPGADPPGREIGEDALEADEHPGPDAACDQGRRRGAGAEIAGALHHRRQGGGEITGQGDVFAKGHEMDLVIALENRGPCPLAHEKGAVVIANRGAVGLEMGGAGDQGGGRDRALADHLGKEGVAAGEERQGGLRPDHQLGVVFFLYVAGEGEVGVHGVALEGGAPFLALVDIALDHGDGGAGGGGELAGQLVVTPQAVAKGRGHAADGGAGEGRGRGRGQAAAPADQGVAELVDDDIDGDDVEGDPGKAGEIGGLRQGRGEGLGGAEIHPGKTGAHDPAQVVEAGPGNREDHDLPAARQPGADGAAGRGVEPHVTGQSHQGGHGQPQGQTSVTGQGDDHPVDEKQILEKTEGHAQGRGAPGAGALEGVEQGDEGNPGQGRQGPAARRGGKDEQTAGNGGDHAAITRSSGSSGR